MLKNNNKFNVHHKCMHQEFVDGEHVEPRKWRKCLTAKYIAKSSLSKVLFLLASSSWKVFAIYH